VLKKAHAPPEKHRELVNDSEMHQNVCAAFEGMQKCKVPKFMEIIKPTNDDWWQTKGSLIPESELQVARSRERTPILASERIWPFPHVVRDALITTFCADLSLQEQARKDKKNRDCLVRIYLGARNHMGQFNTSTTFSLRNFPLSLEKMEVLDLDKLQLASSIAGALATLHWRAEIDARDVEFVLGMAPRNGVEEDNAKKRATNALTFLWTKMVASRPQRLFGTMIHTIPVLDTPHLKHRIQFNPLVMVGRPRHLG
jgi:hypothetical protein